LYNKGLFSAKDYTIQFEILESLGETSGTDVSVPIDTLLSDTKALSGRFNFAISGGKILLAKVTRTMGNEHNYFWQYIPEKNTPYLVSDNILVSHPFITSSEIHLGGFTDDNLTVSYYSQDFPAAAPPFSTKQTRVSEVIMPDSTFAIQSSGVFDFKMKGLYLIQEDTASDHGLAFRKEINYPKLGTIEGLIGPLIYLCTRQEYDKLQKSEGEKKKFDQVILSITGDAERAKNFMRYFFTRVELANLYFSSYKEGWKSDRGMILIVYGLPDAVYLFGHREVWEFKNEIVNETFEFTRSSTIFDPDNFVLVRDKKFEDSWYRSIDLLRKSRF
jgi:GWxTD domain-containing protein